MDDENPNPNLKPLSIDFSRLYLLSILHTFDSIMVKKYHNACVIESSDLKSGDIDRMQGILSRMPIDDSDVNLLISLLDDYENNAANVYILSRKIKHRINNIIADKVVLTG